MCLPSVVTVDAAWGENLHNQIRGLHLSNLHVDADTSAAHSPCLLATLQVLLFWCLGPRVEQPLRVMPQLHCCLA
jgi:hypothetical protein